MCDDWEFSSRHTGKRPNGCQGRVSSSKKGKDRSEHRISNLNENLRIVSRFINPLVAITAKFFPRCPNTPVFVRSKAADNLAPSDPEWPLAAYHWPSGISLFSVDHGRPSPSKPRDATTPISSLPA